MNNYDFWVIGFLKKSTNDEIEKKAKEIKFRRANTKQKFGLNIYLASTVDRFLREFKEKNSGEEKWRPK